jgi:hypothetical protein
MPTRSDTVITSGVYGTFGIKEMSTYNSRRGCRGSIITSAVGEITKRTTITILDIIHPPVFYLKYNVPEIES